MDDLHHSWPDRGLFSSSNLGNHRYNSHSVRELVDRLSQRMVLAEAGWFCLSFSNLDTAVISRELQLRAAFAHIARANLIVAALGHV